MAVLSRQGARVLVSRAALVLAVGSSVVGESPAQPAQLAAAEYQTTAGFAAPAPVYRSVDNLLSNILHDQQTLQIELQKVGIELAQAHLRATARGRAYVRLTRVGLLPASGGVDSLIQHASSVERLRRALDRDLVMERELMERKARLSKKNAELEERLQAMQAERELMEQNRLALDAARDRALAFERAFSSPQSPDHTAIYGAGIGPAEPAPAVSGFAALRGRLPFPLTGRTEVRPAKRRAASGPALEMVAPAGSVVRAVYPGTVAFADEYADYGKSIIVDHGEGYFSVSANLATIDVKVGDDVGSGARLATVGINVNADTAAKGSAGASSLYFELRHGTDTLDPAAWFGI